jgi:hypothetical protein
VKGGGTAWLDGNVSSRSRPIYNHAKLLSVDELRRVIAILKSHRRHTIGELPPGPASVVDAIIRDARLREGGRS